MNPAAAAVAIVDQRALRHAIRTVAVLVLLAFSGAVDADALRDFTVSDDIELAQFGDVYTGKTKAVTMSPDGKRVAVHLERGSLKVNQLQDELRIYSTEALRRFLASGGETPPAPIWTVREASNQDGPLIKGIRWLADSSGIAFLLRSAPGYDRLFFADLTQREVAPLTPEGADVMAFDIRDRSHFVFATWSRPPTSEQEETAPAVVLTGRTLLEAAFPRDTNGLGDRSELWAGNGGTIGRLVDPSDSRGIVLFTRGEDDLSLSPDGRTVATQLAVSDVPRAWESGFPPPYAESDYRIKAGTQELSAYFGLSYVSVYVHIDLKTGRVTPFASTPVAGAAGWFASLLARPTWSDDGRSVLLPGLFLPDHTGPAARPCVAVADLSSGALECVVPLGRQTATGFEPNYRDIEDVKFVFGRRDQVALKYRRESDGHTGVATYVRSSSGTWRARAEADAARAVSALEVVVRASFKDPPVLIARDPRTGVSKEVLDPNPQLRQVRFGEASLHGWKDRTSREWSAILFKPPDYDRTKRYPLVIQNHGFAEDRFTPSGGFPSSFAAQELAASGIVVLQMRDCPGRGTPTEGPCNVVGYEDGTQQLANEGLIDPDRVGLIGFSRTVYYVMAALTTSSLRLKAASITDGMNLGYLQHLFGVDNYSFPEEDSAMIGAAPYGPGLRLWLERSPEFNMDKVTAPLRVVTMGSDSVLGMWEPYALLRAMHKPVDLIRLNSDEHVLTNPAVRLAAQTGTVDWFRFWLQSYEDPDPAKAEQYQRWRDLRLLRDANRLAQPATQD